MPLLSIGKKVYSDAKSDVYYFDEENKKKEKDFHVKVMINYLTPIYPKSTASMKLKIDCEKSRIIILRKSLYVEKGNDFLDSREFNQGNFLSDRLKDELAKRLVCNKV